jgi:hypothetical protein
MALLVLWLVVYFLIEVFRGVGAAVGTPTPDGTALAVATGYDEPIAVEWELMPPVEQTADRN